MTLLCIPQPAKKSMRNDVTVSVIYVNRTPMRRYGRPITSQSANVKHFSLSPYLSFFLSMPVEQMAMITANDSHQFTTHSCGQKPP